jgi:hypothetical protein
LLILELYDFNNDDTLVFYFLSGSTLFVLTTGIIVSFYYKSSKPYFEYLFPKIITKINDEEGLFLTYDAYPKLEKTFNEEGGMFPKGVSITTKRVVSGYSKAQNMFQIIDCIMTTSSGNSQVTHFYGSYIYFQIPGQTNLQVRTNGSPKVKDTKYKKIDVNDNFKVYKPLGIELTEIDHSYIHFMNNLWKDKKFKHLYLSINQQSCHLALWYKKNPLRKRKVFSLDSLNEYYKDFMFELHFIDDLEQLS